MTEEQLRALEKRVTTLERDYAVGAERHTQIVSRLDKIEGNISKLVWLIVTAIAGGFMGFIMRGGMFGG